MDDITRDIGEFDEEEKQKYAGKIGRYKCGREGKRRQDFLNKYKENSMNGNTILQDLDNNSRNQYNWL